MYRPATAARPGRTMARNSSPPTWVVENGTARRIAAIAAAFGASQLWQCGRGQSLHQADPDILLCSCRASCISLCILLSLSNSARGSGGVSGLETRARGALATRLGVTCSVLRCESYHSAVVVEHLGPLELPTNGQQVIGGVQLRAEEHTISVGTRWRPGTSLLAILTNPATRTEDWKLLTCCSVAPWTCALLINLAYASSSEDVLSSSRCSRAARSTSAMHAGRAGCNLGPGLKE